MSSESLNDPHGLLKNLPEKKRHRRLETVSNTWFQKIIIFVKEFGRLPQEESKLPLEAELGAILRSISSDEQKSLLFQSLEAGSSILEDYRNSRIETTQKLVTNLENHDPFGLLSRRRAKDIHKMKNVSPSERLSPDYYAKRKRCSDFAAYEPGLVEVSEALTVGARKLREFHEKDLVKGGYFVLSGVLFYLENLELTQQEHNYNSGSRTRIDGRTRCIFDNGTEADLTFRSLVKALNQDGYSVASDFKHIVAPIGDVNSLGDSGFIYVLRTLRQDLLNKKDLYKIGFTTGTIEQRTRNSEREATYLFSKVSIVAAYRCQHISSHSLEKVLHQLFAERNLSISLLDPVNGKTYQPREWFEVPFQVIDEAINLTVSGVILNYTFVPELNSLVLK